MAVRKLKELLFSAFYFLFFAVDCFCETLSIRDFRRYLLDAKAFSYFGTYPGGIDNPQAGFINPASLSTLETSQIQFSWADLFGMDLRVSGISYGMKMDEKNVFSITWASLKSFDMPIYDVYRYPVNGEPTGEGIILDENGNPVSFGSFRQYQNILMLTHSSARRVFSYGFNARYMERSFGGNSTDSYLDELVNFASSCWVFDAGFTLKCGGLEFPFSFFNLASTKFMWNTEEPYSEKLLKEFQGGVYFHKKWFIAGAEVVKIEGEDEEFYYSLGCRKGLYDLRFAYREKEISAGFGIKIPVAVGYKLLFDYGFRTNEVFDASHYFTAGLSW